MKLINNFQIFKILINKTRKRKKKMNKINQFKIKKNIIKMKINLIINKNKVWKNNIKIMIKMKKNIMILMTKKCMMKMVMRLNLNSFMMNLEIKLILGIDKFNNFI